MTDAKPSFDVFHCPSCGKPTTATLPSCRHCKSVFGEQNSGKRANRIFADEGPGAKWGCLGSLALLLAVAGGGLAFCNHETAERANVDALQRAEEAKEEEAHYQDRVRSGQVCADGPNDLNTALGLNVKRQLKDPDSFEHMGTVITPSPKGGYDALMRYKAKNSLGGYVVGTAVATLYVAERGVCEVRTFKVAG